MKKTTQTATNKRVECWIGGGITEMTKTTESGVQTMGSANNGFRNSILIAASKDQGMANLWRGAPTLQTTRFTKGWFHPCQGPPAALLQDPSLSILPQIAFCKAVSAPYEGRNRPLATGEGWHAFSAIQLAAIIVTLRMTDRANSKTNAEQIKLKRAKCTRHYNRKSL